LPDTSLHFEAGFAVAHSAGEVIKEAPNDISNLLRYPISSDDAPQTFPMHAVEGLFKVYEVDVKLTLPLCALLYDVTQGKDLVSVPLSFPKPCLPLLSCLSTASAILWMMILARVLLGTDSKVIPRQLL